MQLKEVKIFRETGESEFLTDFLVEGETLEELVGKIEANNIAYKKAFASVFKIKRQALKDLNN